MAPSKSSDVDSMEVEEEEDEEGERGGLELEVSEGERGTDSESRVVLESRDGCGEEGKVK